MSRPHFSLGSCKITLQTAILGCEIEDAFQELATVLIPYIRTKIPHLDIPYFPVDQIATEIKGWLLTVDTVGEACIVRVVGETDSIAVLVKPVVNFMNEPDFKLLCVIPITEQRLLNGRPSLTVFKY